MLARKIINKAETRTIILLDAVNFTQELKTHGKPAIAPKINKLKEFAEFFAKRWGRLVGPVRLVYARTPEGRGMLLRARVHSLAGAFQKRSERVSCWK